MTATLISEDSQRATNNHTTRPKSTNPFSSWKPLASFLTWHKFPDRNKRPGLLMDILIFLWRQREVRRHFLSMSFWGRARSCLLSAKVGEWRSSFMIHAESPLIIYLLGISVLSSRLSSIKSILFSQAGKIGIIGGYFQSNSSGW